MDAFVSANAGGGGVLTFGRTTYENDRLSLIWEDAQGRVWVTFNSPAYLQEAGTTCHHCSWIIDLFWLIKKNPFRQCRKACW